MPEFIIRAEETDLFFLFKNYKELIRCKDCGQREYGCSTFIDHNQIYGFCAWGWKVERKEE